MVETDAQTNKEKLPNYSWIKFWIQSLEDPELMSLPDVTIGLYLKLYLMAGRADSGGLLRNRQKVFSLADIAWSLHSQVETLKAGIDQLVSVGLISAEDGGFSITRFIQEQGPGAEKKREEWREQQKKHRSGLKELEPEPEQDKKRIEGQPDIKKCQPDTPKTPEETLSYSQEDLHAWNMAIGDLQKTGGISQNDFKNWCSDLQLASVDDSVFTVKAINKYAAELVQSKYAKSLENYLKGHFGREIKVTVTV